MSEVQPSVERLLAIIELQNAIASTRLDLDTVMRIVVDRVVSLTGAAGAVIEIAEGDDMVYRAVAGLPVGTLGTRIARAASLSGLCMSQGRPLRCDDTETDERADRDACRRRAIGSMICVPLIHGDRAVGVLKIISERKQAFSDDDVAVLELFAQIVAASMHHAQSYESVVHQSLHDALTGLFNRRAFDERLPGEIERHRRYGRPLTLLFMDLDGFKAANDRWGHAAGDEVLRGVAAILRSVTRSIDTAFRLGGDEFALVLPETTLAGGDAVGLRVKGAVAAAAFAEGTIGISAGVIEASAETTPSELVASADAALYEEKRRKKAGASGLR